MGSEHTRFHLSTRYPNRPYTLEPGRQIRELRQGIDTRTLSPLFFSFFSFVFFKPIELFAIHLRIPGTTNKLVEYWVQLQKKCWYIFHLNEKQYNKYRVSQISLVDVYKWLYFASFR